MADEVINLSDGESDVEIVDSRPLERPILIPSSDDEDNQNVDNNRNMNNDDLNSYQQQRDSHLTRLRRHPEHFTNENHNANTHQNVDDDSVEFISEQQIPGGNEFTTNVSPRSNFFHLHLPNGRMLLSRMMFDDGSPPPGPIIRRNRIFPQRLNTISSAQQRQATLRQNRLRRLQEEANQRARIAATTSNNNLTNTLFTLSDDDDDDDADYVQDELINDDLHLISSTDSDTPPPLINLREHEIDYNRREGISPIFMLRQMFGDFANNFNSNNNIEHRINDEIPSNIMEEIRRREEQLEDKRFKKRMASMDKQRRLLEKKNAIPISERDKYTSILGSKEEPSGCELCGVQLFNGIPAFDISDNFDETFNLLVQAKFKSPWCSNLIDLSEVDKELSKKAYFCKCGHIYCGRCVKNIKTQLGRSAGEKRSLVQNEKKLLKSIDPNDKIKILKLQANFTKNYSPTRCVGFNCSSNFTNKKSPFTQLFF